MKILRLILGSIVVIALCVVGASLMAISLSDTLRSTVVEFAANMDWVSRLVVGIAGLVAVIACLIVLLIPNSQKRVKPDVTLRASESGEVSISANALESLATIAVKDIAEIRDIKVNAITGDEEDLSYIVSASLYQNADVQSVTRRMQGEISEFISDRTGLPVKGVDIRIENSVPAPETGKLARVK